AAGAAATVPSAPVAATVAPVAAATPAAATVAPTRSVAGGGEVGFGSAWTPENATRKFTGSVDSYIADAQRHAAAPQPAAVRAAAPVTAPVAATASQPVTLTVGANGEARTAAGLIVPSYASPATGFVPGDTDPGTIARLAQAMAGARG
ncbi:MAG: hypothetical protein JWM98_3334, partial [Thermoleophilia bacterium]|nr:hypothetical protein [Thermoleophilia bacterium]